MSKQSLLKDLCSFFVTAGISGDVSQLQRITLGANKEVWRFVLAQAGGNQALVLKRNPIGQAAVKLPPRFGQSNIRTEAKLVSGLQNEGLKLPKIVAEFGDDSELGEGFIMSLEPGESAPKRVLGLVNLAKARANLAVECGQQLATLHSIESLDCSISLPKLSIEQRLDRLEKSNKALGNTSPIHARAQQWLRSNVPSRAPNCIVHGDFRLGNLLIGEGGLSSIIDWELASISYPEEDLGYLTANCSRFGQFDNPVGGFGQYNQLLDAYESTAGWRPDISVIYYWQLLTAVKWGVICLSMQEMYLSGQDRSPARLAVGRRFSESEADILSLLDQLA